MSECVPGFFSNKMRLGADIRRQRRTQKGRNVSTLSGTITDSVWELNPIFASSSLGLEGRANLDACVANTQQIYNMYINLLVLHICYRKLSLFFNP